MVYRAFEDVYKRQQLERGNNGLIKTKFLTFTIEAKDIKSARARLADVYKRQVYQLNKMTMGRPLHAGGGFFVPSQWGGGGIQ